MKITPPTKDEVALYSADTFGKRGEAEVIRRIKVKGFTVTPPTQEEDRHMDIDCWIGSEDDIWNGLATPVSIKTIASHYINFAAEEEVVYRSGAKHPSWFINGQATDYLVLWRGGIWHANKRALLDDKDDVEVRGLSRAQVASQKRLGHPHVNAKLLLFPMERYFLLTDY